MNITAKTKDDTLKEILEGSMGCDKDMESVLESAGYISVIRTNMANVCQITPSGRAFIAQGGYSAIEQKKESKKKLAKPSNWKDIVGLIIALLSLIAGIIAIF